MTLRGGAVGKAVCHASENSTQMAAEQRNHTDYYKCNQSDKQTVLDCGCAPVVLSRPADHVLANISVKLRHNGDSKLSG